jgi:hypothetical protein
LNRLKQQEAAQSQTVSRADVTPAVSHCHKSATGPEVT